MDAILCDELLEDILHRLPPPSSAAAALVCKRWLRLSRSSTTRLTLRLCPHDWSTAPRLASFLSYFPLLSSLFLDTAGRARHLFLSTAFSDHLLLSIASSCRNLRHLQVFIGAVSVISLICLSASCPNLTSLRIALSRPYSFYWIVLFRSLKDLSILFAGEFEREFGSDYSNSIYQHRDDELQLESLSLDAIHRDDCDFDWLWRSCKRLKKLELSGCEGLGVDSSASSFVRCLNGLREVELICGTIADEVLLKLAENCASLKTY